MYYLQQRIHYLLNTPVIVGELVIVFIILLGAVGLQMVKFREKRKDRQSRISLMIEYIFDQVYEFFEGILGPKTPFRISSYVVNLFIVILLANLLGLALDIFIYPFPAREHYIQSPTLDVHFTLALAIVSVMVTLIIEMKAKGIGHFFYAYFPFRGKKFIMVEKGTVPNSMFYLFRLPVKLFDIMISLFIGALNIVGTLAKVISLAFRLYGNLLAGSILLGVLGVTIANMTKSWLGVEFPIIITLIFYLQSMLVAFVQAFAFSLLTSIFIKITLEEQREKMQKAELQLKQQITQQLVHQIQNY